LGSLVNN